MKTLINERVRHGKYGSGIIIEEELSHIRVKFPISGQVKMFEAPFAFERFLTLENAELQREYSDLAVAGRQACEEKRIQEIHQREEERLREKLEEAAAKKRKTAVAKKK